MRMDLTKKIVLSGDYEDIVEINRKFYIVDKKDRIAVLPYTVSSEGLLDKIGVAEDWNYIDDVKILTLINGYLSTDDSTDLVAANRILFEIIGVNITDAKKWAYLGRVYNNLSSDSGIKIYAVNISDIKIHENVENMEERKKFIVMDSSKVIQTDEILFLSSYIRLFQHFYCQSLIKDTFKTGKNE